MHLIHRKTCRVCGSSALTKVIDLGEQYLQGSFVKPGRQLPPHAHGCRPRWCAAIRCATRRPAASCRWSTRSRPRCSTRSTGTARGPTPPCATTWPASPRRRAALLGKPTARVLDIGCNDGTLLGAYPKTFTKYRHRSLGRGAARSRPSVKVVHELFPSEELFTGPRRRAAATSSRRSRCSTTSRIRSRSPARIKEVLAPEGLWCFEMSYMPTMLKMNSYDTICHEHLEYYSLAVIEHILREAGLQARQRRAQRDQRRLDPLLRDARAQRRATGATSSPRNIRTLRQEEFDLELDTDKPYRNFQERVNVHRERAARAAQEAASARGSASTSTAPRPRGTRSCSGAASTAGWSTSPPSATPTSTGRGRSGPTSRSSARRSRARPSPTTTWCCPGTSATSSSSARRRLLAAGVGHDLPAADHRDVRGNAVEIAGEGARLRRQRPGRATI